MCEICLQSPCASGCPNAEEDYPEERCDLCGAHIYRGETYYKFDNGDVWCEDCIFDIQHVAGEG